MNGSNVVAVHCQCICAEPQPGRSGLGPRRGRPTAAAPAVPAALLAGLPGGWRQKVEPRAQIGSCAAAQGSVVRCVGVDMLRSWAGTQQSRMLPPSPLPAAHLTPRACAAAREQSSPAGQPCAPASGGGAASFLTACAAMHNSYRPADCTTAGCAAQACPASCRLPSQPLPPLTPAGSQTGGRRPGSLLP